jgi:hypothetical protein
MGCYDPDGVTIARGFNTENLSAADKREYFKACKILNTFSLFESSPVAFDKRHLALPVKEKIAECKKNAQGYITDRELDDFIRAENLDEQTARHVAASYNTKVVLDRSPNFAVSCFTRNEESFDLGKDKISINPEVVATWCDKNHIVGERVNVNSATLGKNIGDVFLLFDVSRINTAEKVQNDQAKQAETYDGLCAMFRKLNGGEKSAGIMRALSQSPRALVQWAASVNGFEDKFSASAGVWEGFTVGEHTETALRAFEDTYRYRVPDGVVPIANLCLLVHDIGKGEAVKHNEKDNQKEYNVHYAKNFMEKIGLDPRCAEIVTGLIGGGQDYTSQYFLRGDKDAMSHAREHFEKILEWNGIPQYNNEVKGLMNLCKIVQTCDSVSYTDMAITVSDKLAYRNPPSFNASFDAPVGLVKRAADLKGKG